MTILYILCSEDTNQTKLCYRRFGYADSSLASRQSASVVFTTEGVRIAFQAMTGVRLRTAARVQFDARIGRIRLLLVAAARHTLHSLRTVGSQVLGTVAHMAAQLRGARHRTVPSHMRAGDLAAVEAAHGAPHVGRPRHQIATAFGAARAGHVDGFRSTRSRLADLEFNRFAAVEHSIFAVLDVFLCWVVNMIQRLSTGCWLYVRLQIRTQCTKTSAASGRSMNP